MMARGDSRSVAESEFLPHLLLLAPGQDSCDGAEHDLANGVTSCWFNSSASVLMAAGGKWSSHEHM